MNIDNKDFALLFFATLSKMEIDCYDKLTFQRYFYKLSKSPEYRFMFNDLYLNDDKIIEENSYVDLNDVFNYAWARGILCEVSKNSSKKIVVCRIDKKTAELIINDINKKYGEKYSVAMQSMLEEMIITNIVSSNLQDTPIKR